MEEEIYKFIHQKENIKKVIAKRKYVCLREIFKLFKYFVEIKLIFIYGHTV